jgi:hypothetical protein
LNNKNFILAAGISLLLILNNACTLKLASAPKNPEEFRLHASSGKVGTKIVSHTIERPLADIVAEDILTERARYCLNTTKTLAEKDFSENAHANSLRKTRYHATVEIQEDKSVTISLQHDEKGTSGYRMPTRGYYRLVADLVQDQDTETNSTLTFYTDKSGYEAVAAALLQWANGATTECPRIGLEPGSYDYSQT